MLDEDDTQVIFIVGSGQNIFFTQRAFEDMGLKDLRSRDLFIFLLLTATLVFLAYRTKKSWTALPVLTASTIGFILLEMRRIPEAYLTWDSLYVYFDGALALSFLNKYETILSGRSSPGTSYLTHLYFRLTSPTDMNAIMLTLLLALSILLLSYVIGSDLHSKKNGIAIMIILYTNPYFRDRIPIFASEIPYAVFTLLTLFILSSNSSRRVGLGGVLITLSSYIRPSGLLLYPAAVSYHLYHKRKKEAGLITVASIVSLIMLQVVTPSIGVIGAYSSEMAVKGQYHFNLIELAKSLKDVLYYFTLTLGIALLPGLAVRDKSKNFIGIASLYVLFHLLSLSFWVSIQSRYIFPALPIATIIAVTHINTMDGHFLKRGLLIFALVINLIMLFTGYRFSGIG